ncbi:protein FAM234A isoform X1 [Cygnus atratus]|uniref:protein FAM234A isoform X1 n=1 Tax=Cygnus atratus TaxID=8868 RepID=UPI0015D651A3|nr:protein FAM234A isoform X1 [Cygnus atratus]XP_035405067.1 protein FAM234A isoform X1 [Cygnus atratus]XP_035405068.1 protein FAM234A isoform X1 [Cygnus atratus]XP_035405069.1 protein FAM234A isoform X1 [Cygnus atratus]XP_035405070.1 protein FAM234A isoform X1 [Cygnus atratus]XP_035405071.1 protein FAM234A isoform X1 [Cygnus atratus]XP_035405072.1 protein FAM234A isoform X1 [Cygnus atratus]XP_035405073.1 protein FAM234A isoform X1 [Cygnus atratus]XP_035405074.1 protein FAM234A isoform X1 [
MDNKDSEAEIHPLKTEDVKAQENHENFVERRIISKQSSQLSRLSRWRTAAFFISLFLCLIIVFAFSFIIPCPERPVSERTWFRNYENAVAYQFLAIEDVNKDKVQDVIFAFRASNGSGSSNRTCLDEGLPSPCAFVAAVSGTNGTVLWEKPAAEEVEWMECGIRQLGEDSVPGCLVVGKPASLTALGQQKGEVQWRQSNDFGANYTVLTPLSVIPDVDSDGVQDLIIFIATGDKIKTFIHSGRNGKEIGSTESLNMGGKARYINLNLGSSSYFLFYTANSVYAYSLKDLYSAATGMDNKLPSLEQDPQWEKNIDPTTHRFSLPSSGDIRYLAKIPGASRENILVVNSETAMLINPQNLQTLWTLNVSHVMSEPLLGYYKPDVLGVVLESEIGPNRKKVMIVEGGSGAVQWDLKLNSKAESPGPATLSTADHRSTFLIWGEYKVAGNETGSTAPQQKLYLFHPSYTNVLLELRNNTDQIIAFNATLFERSRHACYVLLTGPQPSEEPGLVSLMKRKLKEDVSESKVIWLSQVAVDSEQYIRDRLYRMRFHSRV